MPGLVPGPSRPYFVLGGVGKWDGGCLSLGGMNRIIGVLKPTSRIIEDVFLDLL